MAACWVAPVLAMEVSTGPAADPCRVTYIDPQDGSGESAWGEERIASELLLKLGIQVSPRTIRKYMPKWPHGQPRGDQRWSTFLKNHAKAIVACDFFIAVTATFRLLYVFVVIEHGSRRLARADITAHPSAEWTLQQLREV
ncbi:MAG: hypothetical protein ACXW14_04810, partial [Burkholderiaceae bacterium]